MNQAGNKITEFRGKIQTRFLAILVCIFVALIGYQLINLWNTTGARFKAEKKSYEDTGRWISLNLSQDNNVRMGVIAGQKEILAPRLEASFQGEKLSFLLLVSADGQVIYEKYQQGVSAEEIRKKELLAKISREGLIQKEIASVSGKQYLVYWAPILTETGITAEGAYLGEIILGLDLSKIYHQRDMGRFYGLVATLVSIIILIIALLYLLRRITRPIVEISEFAKKIGEGDFSIKIPVKSNDEIGFLAYTINDMVQGLSEHSNRLQVMIRSISETIETLSSTTTEIFQISSQQAVGATEQAASVQEAASTSKEIAATSGRIAQGAEEVSKIAEETTESSRKGKEFMGSVVDGMDQIKERVKNVSNRILELGQQSQQISSVIDIINEISEQTNLLALNAAIEAAGAGEAGRRFSVVAGEVRRLAGRTLEATKMVREMVETIQHLTNQIVMLSEEEMKTVEGGAKLVEEMGNYFKHILEMVDSTTQAAIEIRLSTQQQSTASEQMATTLMEITKVASESEKGAKDIDKAINGLNEFVKKLIDLISKEGES